MNLVKSLFTARQATSGKWVAVMDHRRTDRAMRLSSFRTRCLKRFEIHEFLICTSDTALDGVIDNFAYLGFAEISEGGVVEVGDHLYCGDTYVGVVAGFDDTHMPNHFNIIVQRDELVTGSAFGLQVHDPFAIQPKALGGQ